MSNTLILIIECLPVADIPELILHFLIGDVALDSLSSKVFDEVFSTQKYVEKIDALGLTVSFLGSEGTVLHSFLDQPAASGADHCRWFKNGLLHRENLQDGRQEWWNNGHFLRKSNQ